MKLTLRMVVAAALAASTGTTAQRPRFDVLIVGGTIYDGTGGPGVRTDVGITGDRISAMGPSLDRASARTVIDASGLAVAPGFINMLSWAVDSLIPDGRSQSDIRQGVTTEIFGEGTSMGPLTDEMRVRWKREQGPIY